MKAYVTVLSIFLSVFHNSRCFQVEWNQAIEENIVGFIENVISCRQTVGLSVAIVQNETSLMQRVFGYADLQDEILVEEETRFCVGSMTKAFTTAVLGSLLAEYNQTYPDGWDTKLIDVFGPDYEIGDSDMTAKITIRDTLSHRSGLALYSGMILVMVEGIYSRQEYCSRMKYFAQVSEFRSEYAYNNWMFMLGACVAEKITGQPYEELIQERIFNVLGMTSTILSENSTEPGVLPKSYFRNETSTDIREFYPEIVRIFPADPSGGICGPVSDIAKWMQFLLRGDPGIIVPQDLWEDALSPQMPMPTSFVSKPQFPVTDYYPNYGLGWAVGTYREYKKNAHTGQIAGYTSLVDVFKDMNLAVYTNANSNYDRYLHDILHYYITDLSLGLDTWLDNSTACSFPAPWSQDVAADADLSNYDVTRITEDDFSYFTTEELDSRASLEPFVGQYGHPFIGNITVFFDESSQQLRFNIGKFGNGFLRQQSLLENWFNIHFEGSLEYFHFTESNVGLYPPIYFDNLVGNATHGQYQELIGLGLEPAAPPTLYRNFQWDDTYPPQ